MTDTETVDVDSVIEFHGHMCGGLALGIRAAQVALRELDPGAPGGLMAEVETSTCSVDAIQFLTGCTLGKGNLVQKDHGKNAYTFWRLADGKGVRVAAVPGFGADLPDRWELMAKIQSGRASEEERARFAEIQQRWSSEILSAPDDQLFRVRPVSEPPPARSPLLPPVTCAACGEAVMESRAQRRGGKILCLGCADTAADEVAAPPSGRCACSM